MLFQTHMTVFLCIFRIFMIKSYIKLYREFFLLTLSLILWVSLNITTWWGHVQRLYWTKPTRYLLNNLLLCHSYRFKMTWDEPKQQTVILMIGKKSGTVSSLGGIQLDFNWLDIRGLWNRIKEICTRQNQTHMAWGSVCTRLKSTDKFAL